MVHIKHHLLISHSKANQDSKEVRPLRGSTPNSQSIDQESMVLLLWQMTLIVNGPNKHLYIKLVIPCTELEDRVCLITKMILNTDTAKLKEEIIQWHKMVHHQNQEEPFRRLVRIPYSPRESDLMRIPRVLLKKWIIHLARINWIWVILRHMITPVTRDLWQANNHWLRVNCLSTLKMEAEILRKQHPKDFHRYLRDQTVLEIILQTN